MVSRVTMRDIAREAEVSVMTVSLALRNSPKVATTTRKRILEAADKLNYRPDPALSALVTYRQGKAKMQFKGALAYINALDKPNVTQTNRHHRELFEGARVAADAIGYNMSEFWLGDPELKEKPARASQILKARGIQGLLIGPQMRAHAKLSLDWEDFSVVQLFFSLESPRFHTITNDLYWAIYRGYHELCKLGYRRVGLLLSEEADEKVDRRYSAAYLAVQQKLPKTFARLPPLSDAGMNERTFRRWMDRNKPDALINLSPKIGELLKKLEIEVPENLGLVFPYPLDIFPCAMRASVNRDGLGSKAAQVLAFLIESNEKGIPALPIAYTITPIWHRGQTTRKVGHPVRMDYPALNEIGITLA